MNLPKWVQLVFAILLCQLAGIIGSVFTMAAIPMWYAALEKPVINPPNWLFGPVWVILYTLLGVVLYFLWQWRHAAKKKEAEKYQQLIYLLYINLAVNTLWSIVFFGMKNILFGVAVIALVWGTTGFLMLGIYRIRGRYAWLLMPYFLWVSFATMLNILIWSLNRFLVL